MLQNQAHEWGARDADGLLQNEPRPAEKAEKRGALAAIRPKIPPERGKCRSRAKNFLRA
jgi:hypothetical protein